MVYNARALRLLYVFLPGVPNGERKEGHANIDLSDVYICQSIDRAYFDLYGEGTSWDFPS